MKRSLRILLLSIALAFTLMPAALASADDAVPTKISFNASNTMYYNDLENYISWEEIYRDGNSFTIEYSNGSTKTYSYNASTGDWCKNGGNPGDNDYTDSFDFFIQDGKLVIKYYYRDASDTEKYLYTSVDVVPYLRPVSAVFSGTNTALYRSQKEIPLQCLYKKGNSIAVTYNDGSTGNYIFRETKKDVGFFLNGDTKQEPVWGTAYVSKGLKAGKNKVAFTMHVFVPSRGDSYEVRMTANVTASRKLFVQLSGEKCTYTGKVVKPKIVLKDGYGKKIPAKAYTISYFNRSKKSGWVKNPSGKKYGEYEYKVTFKKAYKNKYMNNIYSWYSIGPKPAAISKITAGKESASVKWKKSADADGYWIQCSESKNFRDYNGDTVVKGRNKTSGTLKWLESGKTYYVRVSAYKTVKGQGDGGKICSEPSKLLKVKVK